MYTYFCISIIHTYIHTYICIYIYIYIYIYIHITRPPLAARRGRRSWTFARAETHAMTTSSNTPGLRYKIPVFSDPDPGKS